MLCDRCHNEEASIHIRGTDAQGNIHSLNLCASCALHELSGEQLHSGEFAEAFRLASLPNHLDLIKILSELVKVESGQPPGKATEIRTMSAMWSETAGITTDSSVGLSGLPDNFFERCFRFSESS